MKKKDIKLFIDEAFIEFIKGWEKLTAVNLKDSNIFIMRALTKFFAVPGLRLGYGISYDKEIMKDVYGVEKEEDIKEKIWQEVKSINKTMPKYKYIKGIIVTEEELIKTTTRKVKRNAEMEKITM